MPPEQQPTQPAVCPSCGSNHPEKYGDRRRSLNTPCADNFHDQPPPDGPEGERWWGTFCGDCGMPLGFGEYRGRCPRCAAGRGRHQHFELARSSTLAEQQRRAEDAERVHAELDAYHEAYCDIAWIADEIQGERDQATAAFNDEYDRAEAAEQHAKAQQDELDALREGLRELMETAPEPFRDLARSLLNPSASDAKGRERG